MSEGDRKWIHPGLDGPGLQDTRHCGAVLEHARWTEDHAGSNSLHKGMYEWSIVDNGYRAEKSNFASVVINTGR